MKNRILALLALVLLSTAALPAMAQSCTVISTLPATISTGGKYCLAQNFTVNSAAGASISINANDVTLDCQNYTIRNVSTSLTATSVAITATNRNMLRISNCRIVGGYRTGIQLFQNNSLANQSFYNAVEDNYIAGPLQYGILAYGSAIEVRHNKVYDIGGVDSVPVAGIRVGGSSTGGPKFQVVEGNRIAGVASSNNNAYGILSDFSIASVFRENLSNAIYSGAPAFRSYGLRIMAGEANTITDNYLMGRGATNEIGIQTVNANSWCYDNQIRVSMNTTLGCDASYGNY